VNPASGVLASMGLTRAVSPSWRAVYTSGVVVAVGVRLPAAAAQRMLARMPAMPVAIRMSPTMFQFTNVPAIWGAWVNRES
jgi:hypothetical protein